MVTTQSMRKTIFIILTIWAIKSLNFVTWASDTSSIYTALESHGLPMGLLPKGVKNFSLGNDGKFEVYLDQACNAKFESELHYDQNVSGQLSFGQIRNLTGISAKDLFLWFPVKGIRVDIPSSGVIYFDVGVVFKQFSLSMFETPPDCVAAAHPPDLRMARRFGTGGGGDGGLNKKLNGILQYGSNKEKNAREVM